MYQNIYFSFICLLSIKYGKVIAIEIETGKSDVESNIQKCVDNGLNDIRVFFTKNKRDSCNWQEISLFPRFYKFRHFLYHNNYTQTIFAQRIILQKYENDP